MKKIGETLQDIRHKKVLLKGHLTLTIGFKGTLTWNLGHLPIKNLLEKNIIFSIEIDIHMTTFIKD